MLTLGFSQRADGREALLIGPRLLLAATARPTCETLR